MKTIVLTLTAAALLWFAPARTNACVCGLVDPCNAFSDASAIFIGRMLGGSEKVPVSRPDSKGVYEAGNVRFVVEESFKGDLGTEVTLSVSSNLNTSCGPYGLIHGERYVVYAYGEPGKLSTGVCTRTRLISEAAEDLQFLKSLPAPGTGGRLDVSLWADTKSNKTTKLRSVTVKVQGPDDQTRDVVTNDEGEFELANLKPGKYRVEPIWPKHLTSEESVKEVIVVDRGCSSIGFEAHLDVSVRGRMLDSDGRPVSLMLHLERAIAEDRNSPISGFSHEYEEGEFEITGIPAGEYLLFFDLATEGWKNNKKFYYPGTTDPKQATVIKVGQEGSVEGFEFRLPTQFKARSIEGWVVWKDGSPATDVEVWLLCPKSTRLDGYTLEFMATPTVTDSDGRFRIQGFTGTTYVLEARATKRTQSAKEQEVHSPQRSFTLQEDMINVKLVLSEAGFSAGCKAPAKPK